VTQTVHILVDDRSQSSTIMCPHCDRETIVSNAQFFKNDRSFRVKCNCHNVFSLITNRRRFQRYPVSFTGDLMLCATHKKLATVNIVTLSVDGLTFESERLEPEVGNTFTVAFSLDDEAETAIVDDIVICYRNGGVAGTKFLARNGYNPDIDLYLMNEDGADNLA